MKIILYMLIIFLQENVINQSYNIFQKYAGINITDFINGINYVEFRSYNDLHFSGGYLKLLIYSTIEYENQINYHFPGINGAINIYDGVFIPNNLNYMNLSLRFNSSYELFFAIGNTTLFTTDSNNSIKEILFNNSDFQNQLNYSELEGKTLPLRFGLKNFSGGGGGNIADIIFIVDSSYSMENEIAGVRDTINNFTNRLSASGINYSLGLIDFKDFNEAPCGLLTDYPYKNHYFYDSIFKGYSTTSWNTEILENEKINTSNYYLSLNNISSFQTIENIPDYYAHQYASNNFSRLYGNNNISQVFTAYYPGKFLGVKLHLGRFGNPPPIVVEIWNATKAGWPDNNRIYASIENFSVPENTGDFYFNFSDFNLQLNSNQKYAIVIYVKGNTGDSDNYYNISEFRSYTIPSSGEEDSQSYIPPIQINSTDTMGQMCNRSYTQLGPLLKFWSWRCSTGWDEVNPKRDLRYEVRIEYNRTNYNYEPSGGIIYQLNFSSIYDWYDAFIYNSTATTALLSVKFRSSTDNITWTNWDNIQNIDSGSSLQIMINMTGTELISPYLYYISIKTNYGLFTTNITKYTAKVNTVYNSVNGGNDGPESHLAAINQSIYYPWKDYSKKFIIVISDNMTHAQDCELDSGNTDDICNKGPKTINEVTEDLVKNNIIMYYINSDPFGLCQNREMADDMVLQTKGKFFNYSKSEGVNDIIMEIAGEIVNITFSNQTAVVQGKKISTYLDPDSYIEFGYNSTSYPYGIFFTIEEPFDNNESCNYSMPSNSTIVSTNVLSYSGSRWTNDVIVNSQTIYNLSKYELNFLKLGDPYVININNNLINKDNFVSLHTALSPYEIDNGSSSNKVIYTALKSFESFSKLSVSYEGCNWNIQFEDGSTYSIKIPQDYSGTEICNYKEGDFTIKDSYYNDALKLATYNLFKQIDFDSDGFIDIKLTEQSLDINSSIISGIPIHYSTEVQIRRWY